MKSFVAIAEVARPHGTSGELRLRVFNPDSDLLARRPPLRLVCADGSVKNAQLRSMRHVPGAVLVRLAGVTDRDQAEALRGARVEVARDELEPTDEDEYYHCDLENCRVTVAGIEIGRVVAVVSYPTCDALVVEHEKGRLEVPLVDPYLGHIDIDAGVIELHTIQGLE